MLPLLTFDHTGIVVDDIGAAAAQLSELLPLEAATCRFDDAALGVSVQFVRDRSGVVFELIAPFGDKSPVAAILKAKTGILNQLAYRVSDLDAAASHFRSKGALPTGRARPAVAFGGALVQFFYFPQAFIVELIATQDYVHPFEPIAR